MRMLLLGASGFTGHNMASYFGAKTEYDVTAPTHTELDALDEQSVVDELQHGEYDIVLNCLDSCAGKGYMERRLRMFANLAHHSDLYGKMIYFGSGAEYGRQKPVAAMNEDAIGDRIAADEYGFALSLMTYAARQSSNIFNLRLFGIFGPYEIWQKRFISNAICRKLMGYPITIRQDRIMSWLDVYDLCRLVEWVMSHDPASHDYNAIPLTKFHLTELADLVNEITPGEKVPVYVAKEGFQPEYSGDGTRVKNEMGLTYRSMEESIRLLSQWYQEHIDRIDRESLLYQ